MTDIDMEIRLITVLAPWVTGKRRKQVISWLAKRRWKLELDGPPLTETDWRETNRSVMGPKIYDRFCEVTRYSRVDGRANIKAVLDRLARRLGDADSDALESRDSSMAFNLREIVQDLVWREDYLRCQALDDKDLNYAANTVWKKEIAPGLTQEALVEIEQRKAVMAGATLHYEDEDLLPLILAFLKQNRRQAWSYNHVSNELRADWKQVSRLLSAAAKYHPDVVLITEKAKGKTFKRYKYAPERKTMDRDHTQVDDIVRDVIRRYLLAHPHQTTRAIRSTMREYFGYIDDVVVHRVLKKLIDDGVVLYTIGSRGAHNHFIMGNSI